MQQKRNTIRNTLSKVCLVGALVCVSAALWQCQGNEPANQPVIGKHELWIEKPQSEWPQITMINQIDYTDKQHPIGGCGFLLDTGDEVLAVTAKHVLKYFKSDSMNTVSFGNTLKQWRMFPKDSPDDIVVLDSLINEDSTESLDQIPPEKDWLLFTIKEQSPNIQPLKFRTEPLEEGETVYIVGWRYSDKDCPQVVYEGNFVRSESGSFLITTKELADNTIPGLSGSPVIDAKGYLLGLMSQKAEKMERPSSLEYPRKLLAQRTP